MPAPCRPSGWGALLLVNCRPDVVGVCGWFPGSYALGNLKYCGDFIANSLSLLIIRRDGMAPSKPIHNGGSAMSRRSIGSGRLTHAFLFSLVVLAPNLALAQASPFLTGATALQTNILAWLTPIAIILIMVLGAMAMANRISWGWCIAAILGIAISFGAPQIVAWVRGLFGV